MIRLIGAVVAEHLHDWLVTLPLMAMEALAQVLAVSEAHQPQIAA